MSVLQCRNASYGSAVAACAAVTLVLAPDAVRAQAPRTLAFQGVLSDASGKPKPNAAYSVTFRLFNALTGGTPLWTETAKTVTVIGGKGQFSTVLGAPTSFGALAFDKPYFLEVQAAGDAAMTPRLPLQSAPYALNAWSTGGNAGSNPSTQFLGTTDNQALSIRVNNRRALLLEDRTDAGNTFHSINVLAGAAVNSIAPGVVGATIAGGGQDANAGTDTPNDVRGDFGVVGGGSGNFVDAVPFATIAGGSGNVAQGAYSSISGGASNTTQAESVTIAGGAENYAYGSLATIGGGASNTVSTPYGTVAGGNSNTVSGVAAALGGGQGNVAGGALAVIGGGSQNAANGFLGTIAGGLQNAASAQYAAIGGGSGNVAAGDTATIAGGDRNTVNGTFTTISGGRQNYGWSVSDFSAIGGGFGNTVYGDFASIPGGYKNSTDGLASFAGGYRAYAAHDGSFVWADAHEADFVSTAANQFCVRASGGLVLEAFGNVPVYTGVGAGEAGRYLLLLNSPRAPSASGLKAGGILCADSFAYANPGKNDMVVKGTLGVGYPNPAPYTFAVNGTVYSAGGYSSSDARFKRNVNTLDGALCTVLALRGVSFQWNRDGWKDRNFPEGRQIGFIAQEVDTVLPEVVQTDAQGYQAVRYESIVPVLVEAVKTLKADGDRLTAEKDAEIARLQASNAAMQRRQDEMDRRLRSLEERLGAGQ